MKPRSLIGVMVLAAAFSGSGYAQEKSKAEGTEKTIESRTPITPLRVQVTFNEFDGEKRISSLPYTLLVNADRGGPIASIRMGLRVPIHIDNSNNFTYLDMGTNIDGRAETQSDGRFLLSLSVERSSAYSPQGNKAEIKTEQSSNPVVQTFRSQLNLLVHDGQTIQTTVSTDPLTGHVIKVEVTVNLVK